MAHDSGDATGITFTARLRRIGESAREAFRQEWREGRLSLAGLGPTQRRVAMAAVVTAASACALLLLGSAGVQWPGQIVEVQGRLLASRAPVAVPTLLIALACIGLAASSIAIAIAAREPEGRLGRRLVLVLSFVLAGLGGNVFASTAAFDLHRRLIGDVSDLVVALNRLTGWLAFISAVLLPILSIVKRPVPSVVVAAVAAMPFVALLATIVLAGDAHGLIEPWTQAQNLDYPSTLFLNATLYGPVFFVLDSAASLLAIVAVWQVATWSRASVRQVGLRVASAGDRLGWLLPALVSLKLAWLLLGGLFLLPAMLGGTAPAWAALRSDDAFSWAYAALLGAGAIAWLLLGRASVEDAPAVQVAARVALAFASVPIALAVIPILTSALAQVSPADFPPIPDKVPIATCIEGWGPLGGTALLTCLGHVLVQWQSVWWAALVAAALIVGLAHLRRRPGNAGAIFLVILGAWTLPRAIDVIFRGPPPELVAHPGLLRPLNAPQAETFDVVVTVLVLVLAVGWWAGWQRRVGPGALIVMLVASTLLVHAGTLLPAATTAFWLAIPLVFPVIYELGFDSERLNAPGSARSGRVLAAIGVRAFALTLLATVVVVDLTRLRESSQAAIGLLFFGIPLAATIVAATVRAMDPADGAAPALSPGRPEWRRPAAGAAAGLAVLAVLVFVTAALDPRVAPAYPTGSSRLAELESRAGTLATELNEGFAQPSDPALPPRLLDAWRRETRWLGEHPPPGCAVEVWSTFRATVDDIREFSILLAATNEPPASAPEEEIAAVSENFVNVYLTLLGRAIELDAVLAKARTTCSNE